MKIKKKVIKWASKLLLLLYTTIMNNIRKYIEKNGERKMRKS